MPDEREAFQIEEDVSPSCEEEGVLPGYRVENGRRVHCALRMTMVAVCVLARMSDFRSYDGHR